MINRGQEKRMGAMLATGIVLSLFSMMALIMVVIGGPFFMATAGTRWLTTATVTCVLFFVGSLVFTLTVLLAGLGKTRRLAKDTEIHSLNDIQILARFATDPDQIMQFPDEHIPEQRYKYWVQVADAQGNRYEFRTAPEVYFQCGEGMRGLIRYQGDWLSMFTPKIKPGAENVGADPFLRS